VLKWPPLLAGVAALSCMLQEMQALAEKAVCAHIEVEADQPMQLTVQHHPTQPLDDEFIVYLGHKFYSKRATAPVALQEVVLPAPVIDFIAAARAQAQCELAALAAAALTQQQQETIEQAEAAAARAALKEERRARAAAKKQRVKQEKREARECAAAAAGAAAAATAEQERLAAAAAAEASLVEEQRQAAVAAAAAAVAQAEREAEEAAQRQREQQRAAAALAAAERLRTERQRAVAAERLRAEQEAAAAAAAGASSATAAVTYGETAMRAANGDAEQLSAIAACTDILVLTAQLEEAAGREGLKYVRKAIRKQIRRLNTAATAATASASGDGEQDSSALAEWLTALGLEQHLPLLVASGYSSVDSVQSASDAQLQQLGLSEGARLQLTVALKRSTVAPLVDAVVVTEGAAVDDQYGVVDDGSDSSGFCIGCWAVLPEVWLQCCKDSKLCNKCLDEVLLRDQPCPLCREPIDTTNYCSIICC
jgi:SAM domain (Sterile alpha motif)